MVVAKAEVTVVGKEEETEGETGEVMGEAKVEVMEEAMVVVEMEEEAKVVV
jgi:hypothetical protein